MFVGYYLSDKRQNLLDRYCAQGKLSSCHKLRFSHLSSLQPDGLNL